MFSQASVQVILAAYEAYGFRGSGGEHLGVDCEC